VIPLRPFYFLRHGEADWNVERRCIGQLDRPLTERGRDQARHANKLCEALSISHVFHSPLARAAETASLMVAGRGWPMSADPGLMEVNFGVRQGAREGDPADPFIAQWVAGAAIDGAETYEAMKTRVALAVARCFVSTPMSALPPLIVAHSGTYHALRDAMGTRVKRVHHCAPLFHESVAGTWRVTVVGEAG
jgi:probable phosphoglycerate mutase